MPAITKPNLHFDATTYTGTNSALSVTNGGFQPDFVWIKSRAIVAGHGLVDSVRGRASVIYSNATTTQGTSGSTQDVTAFNSNGFALGTNSQIESNTNASTYVAWQWKAGGAAVSNTSGTLNSQVSVNTTAGFSVVTYTGSVSYPQTIGHGLGAVPQFIIVKNRQRATNWAVYHASVGNTKALYLNGTDAAYADGGFWNNTSPTSTVFTGDNGVGYTTNGAAENYVAYCWTPIAGYSAFGKYTGNGTQGAGPFVYTGFQPKYVLIKNIDGAYDWHCFDTARGQYNYSGSNILKPNTTGAELTARNDVQIDFLSNGFRLIGNDIGINQSTSTHIYAAFASAPFKYANAF